MWKDCATDLKPQITNSIRKTGTLYQNDIWLIEQFIMVLLSCKYPFYWCRVEMKKKEYQEQKIKTKN